MSAKFDSMPRSAATTGVADHVLTPAEIAKELLQYSEHLLDLGGAKSLIRLQDQIIDSIPTIAETLMKVTNHNFQHYKASTLSRRIQRRMQVLKIAAIDDYVGYLQRHEEEAQTLFRELLIGVTAFFRDPEAFESLAKKVLPNLFNRRGPDETVRIWVAGCASGAEAYTIAMLCREALDCDSTAPAASGLADGKPAVTTVGSPEIQIFATDIDERSLQTARLGTYPIGIEDHVSPERLKRFFIKRGKRYQVTKEIRDTVLFSTHNLISDPPFSRLDLISCRNLLIYLGPHLQRKLIPLFHYALRPGGYLLLGPSENITSHAELFRPIDAKFRISQRKGTAIGSAHSISLRQSQMNLPTPNDRKPDVSTDVTEIRQRIVLDEFAPKSCVIDESGQVINSAPNMQKYLSLGDGDFQNNIIKMAASGLRIGLRAAIAEARKTTRKVHHENLSVRVGDSIQGVMVTVQPMPRLGEDEGLFLVVFHDVGLPINRDQADEQPATASQLDANSVIVQLERELETTRSDLDKSMQDMEAANEELKLSNEELLSMNEELQSANEELETSKEEIRFGSEAVAQANSDLENLLRSSKIATVFLDDELLIRSFTPAISEIYGLISTDIGRPLERFVPHVKDMPPLPDPKALVNEYSIEHTVVADSGKLFIRRVLPYQSHTGDFEGIVVTFLDVTELHENEARFRATFDNAAVGISHVDLSGRWINANSRFCEIVGYDLDTLLQKTFQEITHPDDIDDDVGQKERLVAGEIDSYSMEKRYLRSDGQYIWIRLTVSLVRSSTGEPVQFISIIEDISDRKKLELERERRERILNLALDAGKLGTYTWNITEDRVTWSNQLYEIFGCSREQFSGTAAGFSELVHCDDRESVRQQLDEELAGDTTDRTAEFRVVRPCDGRTVWVLSQGVIERDARGNAVSATGVVQDMTARKNRELEVVEREAHLRRVINNQIGLVGVIDRHGILLEVDDRSLKIARTARDEVIGKHFADAPWWCYDPKVSARIREAMQQAAAGEIVRFDVSLCGYGDEGVLIDFMIAPVFDSDGNVDYLIPSGVDIRQRHQAEQRLIENERRVSMALKAGNMAAWQWTPEKSHWDAKLFELLGIVPIDDPTPELFFKHVHPDDLPALQAAWKAATDGEDEYQAEFRVKLPDGSTRWLAGIGAVIRDAEGNVTAIHGLNRDVTGEKEWQEQILDSEERFRNMANAAPAMLWVTDENHQCNFLSQSWRDFTGRAEGEGYGMAWTDAIHVDDREAAGKSFLAAAEHRDAFEIDYRLRTARGGYCWVIDAGRPRFDDDGNFLGYVGSVIDAHDRHEAQAELKKAHAAAEAANASKSAFLANMSHEIRTPMTAILGYVDLLREHVTSDEAISHLGTIRRNGDYLIKIINDILDISKIEAGKFEINRERFDPARLVEDVRGVMEVRATESNLKLQVEYSGKIPSQIESDPKRLKQILINLVGNAIKFTKQGEVKVVVGIKNDLLHFRIMDTGIGMTEQQREKLFKPFVQGDSSVSRHFGGTGLGLAISRRLVKMLGGKIDVQSECNKGSTFDVAIAVGDIEGIPFVEPQLMTEVPKATITFEPAKLNCRVLVVDDRRDIRFLSKRLLTKSGATVDECEDGQLAVDHIRECLVNDNCPDLILLDMQMPNLDGYETTKQLRSLGYSGPIIALTANAMQGDMNRCIEAGCNNYLSKPIDSARLVQMVAEMTER